MDSISMDMTEDQINGSNLREQKRSQIIMCLKAKFAALGVLDPDLPELDGSKRTFETSAHKARKALRELAVSKEVSEDNDHSESESSISESESRVALLFALSEWLMDRPTLFQRPNCDCGCGSDDNHA